MSNKDHVKNDLVAAALVVVTVVIVVVVEVAEQ